MRKPPRENAKQALSLVLLVVLTVAAIAGPTGLLSWAENAETLEQRKARIAVLTDQRDALRNRVDLLDPNSCGTCGLVCNAGELCDNGVCACGEVRGSGAPARPCGGAAYPEWQG